MSIDGTWFNEHGSRIILKTEGNTITGVYETHLGDASGTYIITGAVDTNPHAHGQVLGFVVAWENESAGTSNSVTTWSGQYKVVEGEEVIMASWLLTVGTDDNNVWHSTLTGFDVFKRYQPPRYYQTCPPGLALPPHPVN